MSNTLNLGTDGNWAVKKDSLLGYNSENGNFKPLAFNFTRASSATVVNKAGLIETVGSGEPRIDYKDDSKGALLLEPTRSNSLLQSNQFNTTWTLSASIDLTSGKSGVGGSNNAWLLKKSGSGARYIQQTLSLSSAQYSCSFYLKAESTNWAIIWCYDGTTASEAYFDLENGVVGNTGGSNFNDATIENVGGGWYRCTLTYTSSTTFVRVYPAFDNGSVGANTDDGIYIQNAQLEQGSYATSYIPTQGSAVTRVADVCTGAGNDTVFNSLEGVIYLEIPAINSQDNGNFISINGGSATNGAFIRIDYGSNKVVFYYNFNNTSQGVQSAIDWDFTIDNKLAFSYEENRFVSARNGVIIGSVLSGSVASESTLNDFSFSNGSGAGFKGSIKNVVIENLSKTNAELIALTSL